MILENEIISIKAIRTVGAIVCFFLWIKMFYWARLSTNLAYYVKLIQDTFIESNSFIFMVMLIIISYSNFYYVVNQNLEDGQSIYGDFYGSKYKVVNSIVNMYMLGALGDFSSEDYKQGYNATLSTLMFILATYVIQVIFMNMLICIMGDTFGRVQENSVSSSMME